MKRLPTVTIGIAAYNSENNIQKLLHALTIQNEDNFRISSIIVYSDASKDKTVEMARKIKSKKIMVIDAKNNNGFAFAVKFLLSSTSSDFVILLNDDIRISDRNLVSKVLRPLLSNTSVGLVGGHPEPENKNTFVEKAYFSSYKAYVNMRMKIKNGHNIFTCDGKIMAFSRHFINTISYPKSNSLMGCVDIYMYLLCITSGFTYKHASNAKVYGRGPSTVSDYIAFTTRINSIAPIKNKFGDLVEKELKKPLPYFAYYTFLEFVKNPLGSIFVVLTSIYIRAAFMTKKEAFNSTWKPVETTKFKLFNFGLFS